MNELDKNEWWDVMRSVKPDLTREEFDLAWEEFQEMKRRRAVQ